MRALPSPSAATLDARELSSETMRGAPAAEAWRQRRPPAAARVSGTCRSAPSGHRASRSPPRRPSRGRRSGRRRARWTSGAPPPIDVEESRRRVNHGRHKRCAATMTVRPLEAPSIASCTSRSDSESRADVASSSSSTGDVGRCGEVWGGVGRCGEMWHMLARPSGGGH